MPAERAGRVPSTSGQDSAAHSPGPSPSEELQSPSVSTLWQGGLHRDSKAKTPVLCARAQLCPLLGGKSLWPEVPNKCWTSEVSMSRSWTQIWVCMLLEDKALSVFLFSQGFVKEAPPSHA